MRIIDNLLETFVTELVTVFEGAVVFGIFLDGVVGEVDILVVDVLQVYLEFWGGGSQISLFENVEIMLLIDEYPHSDVKFAIVE